MIKYTHLEWTIMIKYTHLELTSKLKYTHWKLISKYKKKIKERKKKLLTRTLSRLKSQISSKLNNNKLINNKKCITESYVLPVCSNGRKQGREHEFKSWFLNTADRSTTRIEIIFLVPPTIPAELPDTWQRRYTSVLTSRFPFQPVTTTSTISMKAFCSISYWINKSVYLKQVTK